MKDSWDHGHDDSPDFANIRQFVDPNKMAERQEVTKARGEGYNAGKSEGFRNGLAWGIFCTSLFFVTVYAIGQVVR